MTELLENVIAYTIPLQTEQVVKGLVQGAVLCVSRGASVHILSESCNSEIEFDEVVDAVAWSADYPWLLVVGTRSGRIIFMNSSTSTTLFSQMLDHKCEVDQPVFLSLHFAKGKVLVHTAKDILMLKCDLQSGLLSGCIDDFIKELQNNIDVSRLDLSTVDNEVVSSVLPLSTGPGKCQLISTGHVEHMLCVWEETGSEYVLSDSIHHWTEDSLVVQCDATSCGKYLILLTNKGALSVWMASLLIMINVYTQLGRRVSDFCVYKRQGSGLSSSNDNLGRNVDGLCFLSVGEDGEVTLHLSSLPSLVEDYSVKVSRHAKLVHGEVSEENLYYLDHNDSSSSLQVVHLVQSLPENKVAWLMSQQQFTEALQFAREHGINMELVYKNKAKLLNQKLSDHVTCSPETAELLASLAECWQNIKDEKFIFELVFLFPYLNLDLTAQVLHGIKLLNTDLSSKVNSALNWLTTYKLILRNKPFSSDLWRAFLNTSTLDLVRQLLLAGDLQSVFLLHERHKVSLVEELDQVAVPSLLMCLPEWVESRVLEEWLSLHLLPLLLQNVPQAMDDVLMWTVERIKTLELGEKEGWPGNALRVSEAVLDSISSFKPSASLQPHPLNLEVQLDNLSSLKGMRLLHGVLKDLVFLQSNIQWLDISLSEYRSEPREVVVYRILDKIVATELVEETLKSKVVPYVQRQSLNLDQVLLGYIK